MTSFPHWQQRLGSQRDWVWRGWQTRYTFIQPERINQTATPLILLHGFGASIGHWRHNLAALSRERPVYALDMLGFGASEKAPVRYDIALWVEQVYDFWRTFIRQPAVLIGNSIGSLVCLAAAAAHPEMVRGIAMMSLHDPSLRAEAIPKLLRPAIAAVENLVASPLLLKTAFKLVRRPAIVRKWAALAYANPAAVTDELVEIFLSPARDRGSARAFCALLKAMASPQFGPSVQAILSSLNIPMLLIWGLEDRMISPRLVRPHRFLDYNSNLQLLELDNVGHCPHDECPDRINQILLEWLDSWHSQSCQPDDTPKVPSISFEF